MYKLTSAAAVVALVCTTAALPQAALAKNDHAASNPILDNCRLDVEHGLAPNVGQCVAAYHNKGAVAICRHIQNTRGFAGLYKNFGECLQVVRAHL